MSPDIESADFPPNSARLPTSTNRNVAVWPAWRSLASDLLPLAFFFLVVTVLQMLARSFDAELSDVDEAAHFVTGLMIRNYVIAGLHASPMTFAANYYIHYPKVAFGIWPPLFHFVEAVWMLVFPVSRASVLGLLALITSVLAYSLYRTIRREWSTPEAIGAALLLMALPSVQYCSTRVVVDSLLTLFNFWAALRWGRYMRDGRIKDVVLFGVLGSLSMLTKGNGMALLGLPFIAVVLAGRPRLVARKSFWLGPLIMLALAGPWQLHSWRLIQSTVTGISRSKSLLERLELYPHLMAGEVGVCVLVLSIIGLVTVTLRRHREPEAWIAIAALPLAVLSFHILAPMSPNERYLLGGLPAIAWLAMLGVRSVSSWLPGRVSLRRRVAIVGSCAAVMFVATQFHVQAKAHYGVSKTVQFLTDMHDCSDCVILASSSRDAEGMLIAEMAMREPHPTRTILRADKVLSRSTWDGTNYELTYRDEQAVDQYLSTVPVDVVVLDNAPSARVAPHHTLLDATLHHRAAEWTLVGHYQPSVDRRDDVLVYRAVRPHGLTKPSINIDMGYSLGRTITLK